MSDVLKNELFELISYDYISFRVTPSHKGIELDIFGGSDERKDEIREVIEEWACYGDLFDFLFNSGSCYSYDAEILPVELGKGDDYKIFDAEFEIEINGPNAEEFESIKIDFSNFLIAEVIELNPLEYGLKKFDNESFQVEFFIEEWHNIHRFDLYYLVKDENVKIDLDDQKKKIIVDYIVQFAKSKELQLNLNLPEYHDMTCFSIFGEENEIRYQITAYYKFLYSDVFD